MPPKRIISGVSRRAIAMQAAAIVQRREQARRRIRALILRRNARYQARVRAARLGVMRRLSNMPAAFRRNVQRAYLGLPRIWN